MKIRFSSSVRTCAPSRNHILKDRVTPILPLAGASFSHTLFPLLLSFSLRPMSDGSVFPLSLSPSFFALLLPFFRNGSLFVFAGGGNRSPPPPHTHTQTHFPQPGVLAFSPPPLSPSISPPVFFPVFLVASSSFLLIVQHPTVRGSRYNNYPRNAQCSLVRSPCTCVEQLSSVSFPIPGNSYHVSSKIGGPIFARKKTPFQTAQFRGPACLPTR